MRRRIVGVFETSTSPPKELHAMIQDNVVKLIQPAAFSDPLTEVLREGARALWAQAVEAEGAAFLSGHADRQSGGERQRRVPRGQRPERAGPSGLCPVPVCAPRV